MKNRIAPRPRAETNAVWSNHGPSREVGPCILVASRDTMALMGIAHLLTRQTLPVIPSTLDGVALIRQAQTLRPRVCLLDAPVITPAIIRSLPHFIALPQSATVVLLGSGESQLVARLLALGVRGIVLKESASAQHLLPAVQAALSGGSYLDPSVHAALQPSFRIGRSAARRWPRLAPDELRIASLIAQGFSSKEAAAKLGVPARAVEYRRSVIYKKLGIKGTASLTRLVLEHRAGR